MPNARKGADLRRDPRFALHSATVDPVEGSEAQWPGEAKISGRAIYAGPIPEGPKGDRFRADITEVVHTHLNEEATMLVVEWWTPTTGCARSSASSRDRTQSAGSPRRTQGASYYAATRALERCAAGLKSQHRRGSRSRRAPLSRLGQVLA